MVQALPDKVTAAPAGTSGNFALGGNDPQRGRDYVMYQISGGGYGGNADHDGLTNGCSTIGISKSPPVEIMEQAFPGALPPDMRCVRAQAARASIAAVLAWSTRSNCCAARRAPPSSWTMAASAHRACWAARMAAGTSSQCFATARPYTPLHLSKEQDIPLKAGDRVRVETPGGGGYGNPAERDPELIRRDREMGYYPKIG